MKRMILAAAALCALPMMAIADDDEAAEGAEMGLAGLLSATNRAELPPLTLSAGQPIAAAPLKLKSGTYYTLEIEADGSQELAIAGASFFRAIWIDEIVVNGIEVRPLGIDSMEFDEAGTAEISFIAIKPGSYFLKVPGSTGDSQQVEIVIE